MSSHSFRPSPEGGLNPLLLPIQLPYLMVERIITRVESVLKLTDDDKVRWMANLQPCPKSIPRTCLLY